MINFLQRFIYEVRKETGGNIVSITVDKKAYTGLYLRAMKGRRYTAPREISDLMYYTQYGSVKLIPAPDPEPQTLAQYIESRMDSLLNGEIIL